MSKIFGRLVIFLILLLGLCSVAAVVLAIGTGLFDPWAAFPDLPRPPQVAIDTGSIPLPEPRLPEVQIPESLQGDVVILGNRVQPRPLMARIPAPQQISTEPRVIGTNLFLAILMALVFGASSTMLGNMLRDEEPRIRAWLKAFKLDKVLGFVRKVFEWTLGRGVQRGCLTLPFVALIFALYGIIFAFLEQGTSVFSRDGAFLAVLMAFSVGVISFSGDIARRILGRIWRSDSRFNLYPVNLGIAVVTVAISRIFHLSPGIAFGTPGGADVTIPEAQRERREMTLALLTMGLIAFVGALGGALSGTVLRVVVSPIDSRIAEFRVSLLGAVHNTSLAVFMIALETGFFEMLPLAYSNGSSIFKMSKPLWAVLFIPVAFLFNHTLLNPQSGFLDSFLVSNVRFLWFVVLAVAGVTGFLWFYFNVVDDSLRAWLGIKLPQS